MGKFASIADVVPEPCCIMGTWLRPFCLGHHLLFERLRLPFANDALATCDSAQMVTGIAICAGQSYEDTLAAMLEGRWSAIIARWSKDVRRRRVNWDDAQNLFRAYLADGYQSAPVWRREHGGGITLTAPWEEIIKCKLVAAGFSEAQVLNGYLPGRWYDYFTVSEAHQLEQLRGVKNAERHWQKMFYTQEDYAAMHPEEFQEPAL